MSNLSNRLDEITRLYWQMWHDWRYSQGWRLGPDNPAAMLSPHLVSNWDQLGDEGRAWFRQHAALVLASVDQLAPVLGQPVGPALTAKDRLTLALRAMKRGRTQEAMEHVEKVEQSGDFSEVLTALRKVRAAKMPELAARKILKAALLSLPE